MTNIKKRRHGLYEWFQFSTQEVLDHFAGLPNAEKVGSGDQQFVFVPGTRDDRILLVAHADTVWDDQKEPLKVEYNNGIFYCPQPGRGLGADDRAGIAMLWQLRESGHSLLIPNAEETGCVGSRFLSKQEGWKKIINDHRFAIEMDRMNDSDLAFYEVGSPAFKDYCEEQFPGYKRVHGMWTDICVLCDPMCGMNISVGYYHQHNPGECLKEAEWERTLNLMRKLVSQKELPRFEIPPKPVYTSQVYHRQESSHGYAPSHSPVAKDVSNRLDDILVCWFCDSIMDASEHAQNKECCLYCEKKF